MRILFFALVMSSFLTSCFTPRYSYSPSAHNVPVLTEKGDSKLAAYYSGNLKNTSRDSTTERVNKGNGFDLQAAYAVTDHFAIQAAYFHRNEENQGSKYSDSSSLHYKRKLLEAGAGYYTSLNVQNTARFQMFAGFGMGNSVLADKTPDENGILSNQFYDADFNKIYFQPAVSFGNENVSVSFSYRLSIIKFRNIKTDYDANQLQNYRLNNLQKSFVFGEPGAVFAFGLRQLPGLKAELQMGFSARLSKVAIDSRNFNFSAGIMLDIPKLLSKRSN